MVEAIAPQQPQPDGQAAEAVSAPKEIGMCEHEDSLATYCEVLDMALCNDCFFDLDGASRGRGMTLKQASTN